MLDGLDAAALRPEARRGGRGGEAVVESAGVPVERVDVLFELDMHYLGQTHAIAAPLPFASTATGAGRDGGDGARSLRDELRRRDSAASSPAFRSGSCRCATAAIGRRPRFRSRRACAAARRCRSRARGGERARSGSTARWRETAIWSRLDLPVGALVEGPAVLEQPDATIVVDPGLRARVDALGNVIIERSRHVNLDEHGAC